MTDDVLKQGGYVVVGQGDAGSVDSRGYAVTGKPNGQALITSQRGAAVLANSALIPAVNTHAVLANPAIVSGSASYALFANDPAISTSHYGYVVIQPFYPPYGDLTLEFPFMERRFPECVSFGSQGGPGFRTSVFEFDSGFTATEIEWERMRGRYEANFENATPADVEEVESFFYGMKGRAIAFRYKDWTDYQISGQNMVVGDGTTDTFQIFKRYASGGHTFDRIIKKTVTGTMNLTLDGVELLEGSDFFMLDAEGQIVFSSPPAPGAIAIVNYVEFDVPVRFDTDYLNVSYTDFRQLDFTIPLIEVLV